MWYKALIEKSDGHQEVMEYHETGDISGYTIIWDEQTHGTMPAIDDSKLGGYSKSGDSLVVNDSLATTKQTELTAIATEEANCQTKMVAARALLKQRYDDDLLDADVKAIVEALCLQK